MTRLSLSLLLLLPLAAFAADPLPEGVELRLGSPPGLFVDQTATFSPEGKKLATLPANSGVHIWDGQSGKLLDTLDRFTSPSTFSWTAVGKLRGLYQGYECFTLHEWADAKAAGPDEKTMAELRKDPDPLARKPGAWRRAISPDGRRVAVLFGLDSKDYELRVYTPKPSALCPFAGPDFALPLAGGEMIEFSADSNTLLAVQGRPRRVVAYDLSAKKPDEPTWILDLAEEQKFVEQDGKKVAVQGKGWPSAVLSADGKRVVVEFAYGTFEVWDGPKAKKLHSWEVPWYPIPGNAERALVAVSPDGKRVAISSREKTGLMGGVVYDLDTGKETVKLAAGPNVPHGALKYSPDGKRLYRSYQVWDAETGKELSPATGHRGDVRSVVVSGDGKTVVTAGADLTARGWDAKTGEEKWRADFPVAVTLRQVGPDTAVASELWWSKLIEKPLITLSTGAVSALPGDMAKETKGKAWHGEVQEQLVAISPDGKTAVTVDRLTPALKVWDWPKGTRRTTFKLDPPEKTGFDRVSGVTFSPDGKEVLGVFLYEDPSAQGSGPPFRGVACLERWDVAAGTKGERVTFPQTLVPSLVSDGKRLLVIGHGEGVMDALTGETVCRPADNRKQSLQHITQVGMAISPDGTTLAMSGSWASRSEVLLYSLETGEEVGKRLVGDQWGAVVTYLPDGRLVTAGEAVFVWKK